MLRSLDPQIGTWYRSRGGIFEIVAWDEGAQTIEIQYYDGTVEELELDSWDAMTVLPIPAPEDWSGPFDDIERADLDEAESAVHPESWTNPLNELES